MAAKSARRRFTVFSLSFLDVMSCGFGAVVLIFLIINHRIETDTTHADRELLSESRKLDFLIATGRKDLVDLREQVEDRRKRVADAQRRLESRVADRDRKRDEQDELEKRTLAETLSIEELKSDVDSREAEVKLLQAEEEAVQGTKVREIKGEGDRQYLTGLFVGGTHILIALDISAAACWTGPSCRSCAAATWCRNASATRPSGYAPYALWNGWRPRFPSTAISRSRSSPTKRDSSCRRALGTKCSIPRRSARR